MISWIHVYTLRACEHALISIKSIFTWTECRHLLCCELIVRTIKNNKLIMLVSVRIIMHFTGNHGLFRFRKVEIRIRLFLSKSSVVVRVPAAVRFRWSLIGLVFTSPTQSSGRVVVTAPAAQFLALTFSTDCTVNIADVRRDKVQQVTPLIQV